MKTAVIVVSDLHVNSTVAVLPPRVELGDGGEYRASSLQRALWFAWLSFWESAKELAKDCKTIAVSNGDLVDIDKKFRTNQIVSRNSADVLRMTEQVLEPAEWVDNFVFVRGTEAHTGTCGEFEEMVAQDYDHVIPYSEKIKSWWMFQAEISGVKFEFAHHASMGRLRWTEKNAANKLAFETRDSYIDADEKPPDVVVRSHQHRYADSGGNYKTFGVFTPCWKATDAYIYKLNAGSRLTDIGGCIWIVEDGKVLHYEHMSYKPRRERVWQLKI